jgi:hypothetical protein
MKTNRFCVLLVSSLVVVCLMFSLGAPSAVRNESARKIEKDNPTVDIVVQGALDSEIQPLLAALEEKEQIQMYHRLRIDGKERETLLRFKGDEETMRVAMETPYKRGRLVTGVIGSAFEYNREIDRLLWVRKTYGASSEDMESAFSAGAAEGFKTRFLAIRIISDSEFHSPKLEEVAGEYCAAFVVDVIRKMKG